MHGQREVTSQLSEQLISFPAKGSSGLPAAQAAFMGEPLRGSLMGAYQAWEVTYLVTGLGVAFLGMGEAALAVADLTEISRRKLHVPDTIAALAESPSSGSPLM